MNSKDNIVFHPLAYERLIEEGRQERGQVTECILAFKSQGMDCLDDLAKRIAAAGDLGDPGLSELGAPVQWMRLEFDAISPDNIPTNEKMQLIYRTLKVMESLVLERRSPSASGDEDEVQLV